MSCWAAMSLLHRALFAMLLLGGAAAQAQSAGDGSPRMAAAIAAATAAGTRVAPRLDLGKPIKHLGEPSRLIWSYWHDGAPPAVVRACMRTWEVHSSGWTTRLLNRTTIGEWLEEGVDYPAVTWQQTPQHQSDMFGLALVRRYGGLWMDASIVLTRSLDWVLDRARGPPARAWVGFINSDGTPEIFFYYSAAHGAVATAWWRKLYAVWSDCATAVTPACLGEYGEPSAWGVTQHVHLHPGLLADWLLANDGAFRAAFLPQQLAETMPYAYLRHPAFLRALPRRANVLKSDAVTTLAALKTRECQTAAHHHAARPALDP